MKHPKWDRRQQRSTARFRAAELYLAAHNDRRETRAIVVGDEFGVLSGAGQVDLDDLHAAAGKPARRPDMHVTSFMLFGRPHTLTTLGGEIGDVRRFSSDFVRILTS